MKKILFIPLISALLCSCNNIGGFKSYLINSTSMSETFLTGEKVLFRETEKFARNEVVSYKIRMPGYLKPMFYISRLIGTPGDSIEIRDQKVLVNDSLLLDPETVEYTYILKSNQNLRPRFFLKYKINESEVRNIFENTYMLNLSNTVRDNLKTNPLILDLKLELKKKDSTNTLQNNLFPNSVLFNWTVDNFGPLYIPKKGHKIPINKVNLALYGKTILEYEGGGIFKIENDKLFENDKEVVFYSFKKNYFFVMGDNRHNSMDSRFIGLIPQNLMDAHAIIF